ncbi:MULTISPECIES: hypothetical protein [Streptomyces]|uniref:Integrin-like protein n=1 Tax=Streptomyces canarius TaxID=285453 RepID=A0ABQ3CQK0_9ACTN|nr:hypothetical protein [Streptomyces canarius]GHA35717.1 hypothetical protein GCM10010345_45550 [Streptomyces canarius]
MYAIKEAGGAGGYAGTFGDQVANAGFNRDGYADLAVSDRSEKAGPKAGAGAVTILWGARAGLGAKATRIPDTGLSQSASGVATAASRNDRFGHALSAGDTHHDGHPDRAVGVPEEEVGSAGNAGGVHVLRGGGSGLTGTGSQWLTRAAAGVPGGATDSEALGLFVRLRDFDRDGDADLLVSGDLYRAGLLLHGSAKGVTTSGASTSDLDPAFPQ